MSTIALKPESHLFETAVRQRGINRLVHFTPLLNFISIAEQQALLSVSQLEKLGSEQMNLYLRDYIQSNDKLRLDGMRDYINISIEHPNDKLFQCFRRKYRNEMFSPWCVLTIKPELLWHSGTLFSIGNAASTISKSAGFGESYDKFESLFAESVTSGNCNGRQILNRSGLKPCYPTDVQAEVLAYQRIPISMITAVYFEDTESMKIVRAAFQVKGLATDIKWDVEPLFFNRRCEHG